MIEREVKFIVSIDETQTTEEAFCEAIENILNVHGDGMYTVSNVEIVEP